MARNFVRTSSQYLSNSSAVVSAAPLSMACWIKTTDLTNTKVWMAVENAGLTEKFIMFSTGADTIIALTADSVGSSNAASGTFSSDVWFHACVVFASSTSRISYLNGTPGAENTGSRTPASLSQTLIGGEVSAAFADGNMAEAAIWNIALTADDVTSLSKAVSPLLIRPEGLVAYWSMIGRNSPEIDVVGGFDMTLNASPATAEHPRILVPSRAFFIPRVSGITNSQTVSATAIGIATITDALRISQVLSGTAIGVPSFVRRTGKIIRATTVGQPTIRRRTGKNVRATAVGVPTIVKRTTKTLSAVAVGVATMTANLTTSFVTMSATAIGVATLTMKVTYVKVLNATSTGAASFVRRTGKILSGSAEGSPSITSPSFPSAAVDATVRWAKGFFKSLGKKGRQ